MALLTGQLQVLTIAKWLIGKHRPFALNVFYCNKLTIAKCLFDGHNCNYLIDKIKRKKAKHDHTTKNTRFFFFFQKRYGLPFYFSALFLR